MPAEHETCVTAVLQHAENERRTVKIGRLHIITDFLFQQTFSHSRLAAMAIEGGADTIQFRQKQGSVRHLLIEAEKTAELCRSRHVPLIINDRIEIAMSLGAEGVHLGQEDFPIGKARALMGDAAIIGATATDIEEARAARDEGASYIGFGPVFPTSSKPNPAPIKGLDGLASACAAVDLPVIAIAGIDAQRIPDVLAAGAYGVAVMTAVTLAADPRRATRELAESLGISLAGHG